MEEQGLPRPGRPGQPGLVGRRRRRLGGVRLRLDDLGEDPAGAPGALAAREGGQDAVGQAGNDLGEGDLGAEQAKIFAAAVWRMKSENKTVTA